MHYIDAENVAAALPKGVHYLVSAGAAEQTRAGECLVAPGPVVTRLRRPTERVVFSGLRDANPFFHVVESLWMLAGRDDVAPLNVYVSDFGERFGNEGHIHGAYGHRWRRKFGVDQIDAVVERLRIDRRTRQCVLQMWDCSSVKIPQDDMGLSVETGSLDLTGDWRDRPCNTHVYLRMSREQFPTLHMTVCNRSHDIVWGLYGANAVHFSVLQEYLAARVGASVGELYFWSNNFHMYSSMLKTMVAKTYNKQRLVGELHDNRYQSQRLKPAIMFTKPDKIDDDIKRFWEWHDGTDRVHPSSYENRWFREVAEKVVLTHRVYKLGDMVEAVRLAADIDAQDWETACREWILRRKKRVDAKNSA